MKYTIINLISNEYLKDILNENDMIWTKNYYAAKEMNYDQVNEVFNYIEKHNPKLKIEIREL